MSTITQSRPSPAAATSGGVGFANVLRSEWTKLRTVRSTYWSLIAAAVTAIGLGAAISAANVSAYSQMSVRDRLTFDPTSVSLSGLFFAQLALGVVGVLALSAEYSTGMIRATLSAVPQRGSVLAAKAVVVAVTTLVVGLVCSFAAFWVGQAILATKALDTSLGNGEVLRAVIGGGLYLSVISLFALGLGAIIRHSAGAITALVAIVFVLPPVTFALPDAWQRNFARYLPANAGSAITNVRQQGMSLGAWAGFGVFCAWALVALAVGWHLLRRRDA